MRAESRGKAVAYGLQFTAIFLLTAVLVAGVFYGILAEVDMRELKANKLVYNRILVDEAMAKFYAKYGEPDHSPLDGPRKGKWSR